MFWFYLGIFIASFALLFWSGSRLVDSLMRISRYLGWREFVVAFFIMAAAASLPNLFVGVNSALQGIPELSFGDVIGGNLVVMTFAIGLATLFSKGPIMVESKVVQKSALFASIIAVLPIILILDGALSRADGVVLIIIFLVYTVWLFAKEDNFKKIYNHSQRKRAKGWAGFRLFIKGLANMTISVAALLIASRGIVISASAFSGMLAISLPVLGLLVVGVGNALPELYFVAVSARRNQTWMILGELMGSIIIVATFVLGIVAIIHPIEVEALAAFATARFFLVVSTIFFYVSLRSGRKITKREGLVLFLIYVLFVATELFLH